MIKKIKIIFLSVFLLLSVFNITLAGPIVTQGTNYDTGNYELNDLLQLGVNVTKIILGVVGSLALLMFIYGGFMMLISSGNTEKVTKAKGIIMAAVVGLVIVFASYTIVQFVMEALGVAWTWNTAPIN